MLECQALSVSYGLHKALEGVSIQVKPGEIVVILGANGAGKSTLLNAISGLTPIGSGQVMVDGHPVSGLPPHKIVEAGVALVPEGRRIFGDLTVEENLTLGAFAQRARMNEQEHLDRVLGLFPRLAERRNQVARTMSGGEQQMVAMGRAVMSSPSILMLDEPSLGLSPLLTGELFRTLVDIRDTGVGILLVEQNARQGLAIADRGYLLENGHIIGEDSAAALSANSAVQEAYLGGPVGDGHPRQSPKPPQAAIPPLVGATIKPRPEAMSVKTNGSHAMGNGTSKLIPQAIEDLVRSAEEKQAAYIRGRRAALPSFSASTAPKAKDRPGPSPAGSAVGPAASDALREAIAQVEAAAAKARQRRH